MKFLNEDQVRFYAKNGYLKLSGIYTDEFIEKLSNEYDELFQRKIAQNTNMEATWEGDWKKYLLNADKVKKVHVQSIHDLQVLSSTWVLDIKACSSLCHF